VESPNAADGTPIGIPFVSIVLVHALPVSVSCF
jgi:hypothetical protein